jgi:endonuclease/exonuclease/phosphatase family metal-dependent hydrolase
MLRYRGLLVGAAAATVLLAVGGWSLWYRPRQIVEMLTPGRPLRVMTYNIHHGIDADQHVDLEAIADVIAAENPDVIVLNEVNRARLTNGFVDTLPLISRRLQMRYVYGATRSDGQFGNAILSRYPILEWDNTHYQHKTTEVRGLLRVVIQTGTGPVTIFGTHLDHLDGPRHVRNEQVMEALDIWAHAPRTVLLGDLNAEPDAAELQRIYQVGFVDVLEETGQDNAFTFWEPMPNRRIDFIFQTPDLTLLQAWVVPSRASDHLPVLAELLP